MKTYVPDYYKEFHCIAGACKHSCCRGWEVDIDEESLARYQAFPDILRHISNEDVPHFALIDGERCPFLREDNLCQMIIDHGEGSLCRICADHPRFRNFWTDRVEMGLGLACEEAARIILMQRDPLRLICLSDEDANCEEKKIAEDRQEECLPEDETWLMDVRKELYAKFPDLYAELPEAVPESFRQPATRLWEYLVYRHIADALYYDDLEERIDFITWSFSTVIEMWCKTNGTPTSLAECARVFSNRFEYNTEMMRRFGCKTND